jgi:hypothetical protein
MILDKKIEIYQMFLMKKERKFTKLEEKLRNNRKNKSRILNN